MRNKKCSKCGQEKPLTDFYKRRDRLSGYQSRCKTCARLWANSEVGKRVQKFYDNSPQGKYRAYKKSAKQRGLGFTIKLEDIKSLWNSECRYCGNKIEGVGIDRLNNDEGYIPGNIVASCYLCNMMKRVLSERDFLAHIKCIYAHSLNYT